MGQHLVEDGARRAMVARLQRGLGLLEGLLDRGGAELGPAQLRQLGDEALDLALRHRAHEAVHRPALEEGIDRGDRLDAHLLRQRLVLVDVDLDQAHGALGLDHGLLQRGAQRLAGAAPGGPEIDDHRHRLRGLDHIGHEALGVAVLDKGPGAVCSTFARRADQLIHAHFAILFWPLTWSQPAPAASRRRPAMRPVALAGLPQSLAPRSL